MPSPFPGMNPYLERDEVWHDFHQSFIPELRAAITKQVQPRYFVKIDDHVYVHDVDEGRTLLGRPDAHVVDTSAVPAPQSATAATISPPTIATLPLLADEEHVSFLEIRDAATRDVVTVIELLSPSNKRPGADREQYLAKRRTLLKSPTHLVEIDLLRAHGRMPLEEPPDCDYCVMVSRAEERPRVGLWPINLRDRLPEIPIPLKAPDPDAVVDLQELLHRVYDAAGYSAYVFDGEPVPPLRGDDAAWAADFL